MSKASDWVEKQNVVRQNKPPGFETAGLTAEIDAYSGGLILSGCPYTLNPQTALALADWIREMFGELN